jgi:predicted PurR-regulated permease PerM
MPTAVRILAVLAVIAAVKLGAPVLLPIVLSVLLFYALSPVVDWFVRVHVPRALASVMTVTGLVIVCAAGATLLWPQLEVIVEDIPASAAKLQSSLNEWRGDRQASPIEKVEAAAKAIDSAAAKATDPVVTPEGVISVEVRETWRASDVLWSGGAGVLGMIGQSITILFLTIFLLNDGDSFRRKLVSRMSSRGERRLTEEVLHDIATQIKRFLWVQVLTSLVVGTVTALVLWGVGVRQPALWGAFAGLMNVVPYFGPLIVTSVMVVVAFVQFGSIETSLLVAAATLAVTSLEGYALTPILLSRAASLNHVAIFVSIAFWSWAWGVVGMLLAVPILMVMKAVCDHVPDLDGVSVFISANGEPRGPA